MAAAVAGSVFAQSYSPSQTKTIDLSSLPAAEEYSTEPPKGRGFLGSEAPVLNRSLVRINRALGTNLQPDARLARMAQWIYDQLGQNPSLPSQSTLDLMAQHLGLPEPLPHLLMTQARDAPRLYTVVSARLARVFNLTEYTHIGGVADRVRGGVLVVIALSRRHLTMTPVPRSLPGPSRLTIEGSLANGYSIPKFAHALPGGGTRIIDLDRGPAFNVSADLVEAGVHRLEILAEGPRGPVVIVNFPVYVGVRPADSALTAPEPRRAMKPDQVQSRLVELINHERARAGLDELALDPELSEVARGHSENMRKDKFVAHVSPTAGRPEERLLRAGIVTDLAAENVGRGRNTEEIHKGFMDSPGHRSAILHPSITHVGIGVSSERTGDITDYLVTEVFIRRIPPLGNDARLLLFAEIAASRELDGLPSLREDAALSTLAGETARIFLDDHSLGQDDLMGRLRQRLEERGELSGSATAVFIVAGSIREGFERLEVDPKIWAQAKKVGFGIAQGTRPGLVPNSIVLVLVFAE
jgi:uncharacterized protein YkwD